MKNALIGALLGALIFSASPAMAEWRNLGSDAQDTAILADDSTAKLIPAGNNQYAVMAQFKRVTKDKSEIKFDAGVSLDECKEKDTGDLMIWPEVHRSALTAHAKTDDPVIHFTWKAGGHGGNDIIAKALCFAGFNIELGTDKTSDPKDNP